MIARLPTATGTHPLRLTGDPSGDPFQARTKTRGRDMGEASVDQRQYSLFSETSLLPDAAACMQNSISIVRCPGRIALDGSQHRSYAACRAGQRTLILGQPAGEKANAQVFREFSARVLHPVWPKLIVTGQSRDLAARHRPPSRKVSRIAVQPAQPELSKYRGTNDEHEVAGL